MQHTFTDFSAYHFHEQHDVERIVSVIHRHWFNIALSYVVIAAVVIAQILSLALFESLVSPEQRAASGRRSFCCTVWS